MTPVAVSGRQGGWGWFLAWAVLGGAAALGLVSLGFLLLVPAAAVAALLGSRAAARRSAFGVLAGAGVLLLVVAYLNREGPGTTCWQRGAASGCDEHSDPLPWLVVGAVFLIGGILATHSASGMASVPAGGAVSRFDRATKR